MKSATIFTLLFLATAFCADAQTSNKKNVLPNPQTLSAKSKVEKKKTTTVKTSGTDDKTSKKDETPTTTYTRPDADARRKRYVKSIFGPLALARTVASAGYSTWRNSPSEWGTKWEGFGRRVASGFGKNAIKQTIVYGLDEALKLDSAYYRSTKKDFNSRLGNALISPFTARKSSGKRVFGTPRVVGTYASSIIAYETWYPDRFGFKDGLKSGTISLGFNAAFNVFKEFVWKK